MATLQDLRHRRQSIQSIQKVMSAMKMVAATKFRQLEGRWGTLKSKTHTLEELISGLIGHVPQDHFPAYLKKSPAQAPQLWIVIGADRGLCGSFNGAVSRHFLAEMRKAAAAKQEVYLIFIGKRLQRLATHLKNPQVLLERSMTDPSPELARELIHSIHDAWKTKGVTRCCVLSTHFQSVLKQEVRLEALEAPIKALSASAKPFSNSLYEPSPELCFTALLDTWLYFRIYHLLLESAVSEQGARMAAMEGASRNSEDLLQELDLTYNRTRQAMITKQLIEVVSGANAL